MVASTPNSGATGLGDVTYENLGSITVSTTGKTIKVAGTLNNVPDWTEFSSIQSDLTGYYVAMNLSGDTGAYIGKTTQGGTWKVNPLAACTQEQGGIVTAVQKGQKSYTFQAFANEGDALAKKNGTTYTVDLSAVTYNE